MTEMVIEKPAALAQVVTDTAVSKRASGYLCQLQGLAMALTGRKWRAGPGGCAP